MTSTNQSQSDAKICDVVVGVGGVVVVVHVKSSGYLENSNSKFKLNQQVLLER